MLTWNCVLFWSKLAAGGRSLPILSAAMVKTRRALPPATFAAGCADKLLEDGDIHGALV